jgi:hypothetical protein
MSSLRIRNRERQPTAMSQPRVLFVFDGTAWFIRRLRAIEHELDTDEKLYHCDKHLGGPYTTLESAMAEFSWKVGKLPESDTGKHAG